MSSLRNRLALGARWTLSIRVLDRGIGFVSTLILARLLSPADFGVVAMGTAVQAVLSVLTEFGFTKALVRMRRPRRGAFDTAFTLNVLTGLVIAIALTASIPIAVAWYGDGRVAAVLVALALVSAAGSFKNSGLARYERALDFQPFFKVALARKVAAVVFSAVLAVVLGDYRALLAGMIAGAVVEAIASFRVCGYRPRFAVSTARELFSFSLWWLGSQAATKVGRRGQDLFIGQQFGAATLGQYSVALELATMPTSEFVAPVMKAVFPGYMQMKNDAARLYQAFVRVWAVVALIALPSAVGVACLAEPMIRVVLGSQWAQAAALVTPLAAIGVLQALHGCYWPMLLARRGPRSVFLLSALGATLTLPVFVLLLWRLGLLAAIVGTVVCGIIMLFAGAWLLLHDLRGRAAPLFAALARPALGSAAMAASIMALRGQIDFGVSWIGQLLALIVLVGLGAFVYFAVVTLLWSAIGRPDSAERELITMAKSAIRRRSPREEQG